MAKLMSHPIAKTHNIGKIGVHRNLFGGNFQNSVPVNVLQFKLGGCCAEQLTKKTKFPVTFLAVDLQCSIVGTGKVTDEQFVFAVTVEVRVPRQ